MEHGPEVKSQNTLKQSAKELAVFWDTLTVADITEGTCRQYYNHRNRLYKQRHNTNADISNAMVNRELRTLKAAVNADYKAGRLIEPRHVHTFKETNARRDIPERREVLLMARSARGYMRKFILIAYYTGQRKHTILSLRWANVGGHMIDFQGGAPDTAKRGGQIPMPDKLKSFMKIWRKFSTPTRHVIERRGRPVKDIKKGFKNVRDATGLDFTPYSFRHASIVRQLRAGVTPYDVAKWHETSVDVIEKHYGHYKPQYLEQARRSK
jgi:integrase